MFNNLNMILLCYLPLLSVLYYTLAIINVYVCARTCVFY